MESSKEFRNLMFRMIRCEVEREYEELWKEYNKTIIQEPFVPKKFEVECKLEYTMTPELVIVIEAKKQEVNQVMDDDDVESVKSWSIKLPKVTKVRETDRPAGE